MAASYRSYLNWHIGGMAKIANTPPGGSKPGLAKSIAKRNIVKPVVDEKCCCQCCDEPV